MHFSEQDIKVYSNEYGYFTRFSKHALNGEWINGFFYLQFKKGVNLDSKTKIHVKDAWLSFYINKDGKTVWYIYINDFDNLGIVSEDDSTDEVIIPGKD